MAASSPALSNNGSETPTNSSVSGLVGIGASSASINTSKNLRGLNKPKCIKCKNVARSRCPYQSCKRCCAQAQNPCHIHVLKGGSNIPDKIPSSGSPIVDRQANDTSHSGSSHRGSSLRQLSNNFAQFNNLNSPVRSRKTLTRKDAQLINEWRFLKLKEFRDRNIEAENDAFDRYMRNVHLLEEVFSANCAIGGQSGEGSSTMSSEHSVDDSAKTMIRSLKAKLRSNPVRIENLRKRVQYIVDQGLRNLSKSELNEVNDNVSELNEMGNKPKKLKSEPTERASALSDLIDKLNKARNEEDLKACHDMRSQLFSHPKQTAEMELDTVDKDKEQNAKGDLPPKSKSIYSLPKWISTVTIDQETLNRIDAHFSSLEDVEDL